ncbi:SGNH/GDSL hydrolase family protein [Wenxinia marina]|uniref:Lysophospholipase L1 n=1 Tax=Wenxinia marina DSM 24838 TaxID=1123501 RepID=A0A0D0Q8W9_9RHOB|nr:SGNH/GDSL hydrolase family protein [Wenxinia marina]KIQ70859.1 Lysophospholipase L1 [Wenxinia marina DSM 24838]GGL56731.1 hypothetical protein GCM10011392_09010 [Wenxinia marina]
MRTAASRTRPAWAGAARLAAAFLGLSCAGPARADGLLAIGDSLLSIHAEAGASVPDVVASELGMEVENRAVSGTVFGALPIALPDEAVIGTQWIGGDWDWVLLSGGANDIALGCGCLIGCGRVLGRLISEDGTHGLVPDLAADVRGTGAGLAVVLYAPPGGPGTGFDACLPLLDAYRERLDALAAADPGIRVIDAGTVIARGQTDLYEPDLIHPSPEGAARLGRLVADVIATPPSR